ncbi:MAG: aldo/keto reductase [Candidatus Competibacteraceae bacterium]|nr:aldo/keto reductase [Candidatus Competibacteraceae bacterium]
MELRALGSIGIKVSALGLGTVKFGRNQGVKYPRGFALPSDQQIRDLLAQARELGINLLDTAPAYGSSEERLGRLLPPAQSHWIISTKVGETFQQGKSVFDFSAAATQTSVERSLRLLRREHLDLVLIHSDGDDERILQQTDCLEALLTMKARGWIRAVGMSSKTVAGGLLAVAHCDVVMVTYNLSSTAELPVIRQARQAGKGVLIKKGLLSGHLQQFQTHAADPVAASMRLLLSEPGVSSVVIGTLNPGHLQANVAAACLVHDNAARSKKDQAGEKI